MLAFFNRWLWCCECGFVLKSNDANQSKTFFLIGFQWHWSLVLKYQNTKVERRKLKQPISIELHTCHTHTYIWLHIYLFCLIGSGEKFFTAQPLSLCFILYVHDSGEITKSITITHMLDLLPASQIVYK